MAWKWRGGWWKMGGWWRTRWGGEIIDVQIRSLQGLSGNRDPTRPDAPAGARKVVARSPKGARPYL